MGVVGLGISNVPLIQFLASHGFDLAGLDQKTAPQLKDRYQAVAPLLSEARLGEGYLADLDFDVLFLGPGVKRTHPALVEAARRGVRLSSEIELFFQLCRGRICGVTGSAGKTTTTTLVGEMLRRAGLPVRVGGNIGVPLIAFALDVQPNDPVVLELSSFQLQDLTVSPPVAVVTNIAPNHLDYHASMDEYVAAKERIFACQAAGDWTVLNADDPATRDMAGRCPGRVLWFSLAAPVDGAWLEGDALVYQGQPLCRRGEVFIPGLHNVANLLAASLAAGHFGVPVEAMAEVARSFQGVPHRIELVRELDGVVYLNDSKATAPNETMAALAAVQKGLVLILGGSDKKSDFRELAEAVCGRARVVILVGAMAGKLADTLAETKARLGGGPELVTVDDYPAVVAVARRLARPGEAVLLSPGCPSFDMFANFEDRGDTFKRLVQGL